MLKKTIKYTDFNGSPRTEDFYFNMTKTELYQWENSVNGGMTTMIKRISQERDISKLIKLFETIIDASYGVKSDDGKHFYKTPEALADFKSTGAYDELYMEFVSDTDKASTFIKGIVPPDLAGMMDNEKTIAEVKRDFALE